MKSGELAAPGLRLERNVEAQMRDGTILRSDIYSPVGEDKCPVLLMRIPYNKTIAQSIVYLHPTWYARQGFQVIVQDTRGRYASDGIFEPYRHEATDGYDSVEWAASLDGNNGRVGMYGFSYGGATQLLAAAERPPALHCCAPGFTGSDFYNHWTYDNGALNLAFILSWTVGLLAPQDAVRADALDLAERLVRAAANLPALYSQRPLGDFPLLAGEGVAQYFFDWLGHDVRDEYWQAVGLEERYDAIETPCLHFGGWYDSFSVGTVQNFQRLSERERGAGLSDRLIMGPWTHQSWGPVVNGHNFGQAARNIINEQQVAWFKYWLLGDGKLAGAPVQVFMGGCDRWQELESWPPDDRRTLTLYFHSNGDANSISGSGQLDQSPPQAESADIYVFDPSNPVPSLGGRSCCNGSVAPMGPACQIGVELRNDVLVYTSAELTEPLRLVGAVEAVLFACSSTVDTDWAVRITDVDADGSCSLNVCDGFLRAKSRNGLESHELLEPGKVYEYHIELSPACWEFARGHRVRVDVTSSDYPSHDVNPNTGQRTVDVGPLDGVPSVQTVLHDSEHASRIVLAHL